MKKLMLFLILMVGITQKGTMFATEQRKKSNREVLFDFGYLTSRDRNKVNKGICPIDDSRTTRAKNQFCYEFAFRSGKPISFIFEDDRERFIRGCSFERQVCRYTHLPQPPSHIDKPCQFDVAEFERTFETVMNERLEMLESDGYSDEYLRNQKALLISTRSVFKQIINDKLQECADAKE